MLRCQSSLLNNSKPNALIDSFLKWLYVLVSVKCYYLDTGIALYVIQTDMNYNELLHPLKLACPSYNLSLLSDDLQRYGVLARNHCSP